MRLLLIDNHDSFSAILHHYLWELAGERPWYYRNDALTAEELRALSFEAAVLSPGPGHPANTRDFGVCRDLLELYPQLPILGVCLGHQGLAHFAGARVSPWNGARHGRPSPIHHDGQGLFRGLPQGFTAIRYHSLTVAEASLPGNIQVTATSADDGQVMGLAFRDRPWFGVQFHPESVGTEHGKALLANFLDLAQPRRKRAPRSEKTEARAAKQDTPETTLPFRELAWRDPETVFMHHFAGAPAAFWLDAEHSRPAAGWPITLQGRADVICKLLASGLEIRRWDSAAQLWREEWRTDRVDGSPLELFAARIDAVFGNQRTSAPWTGYRGGPVGHFTYELARCTLADAARKESIPSDAEPLGRWLEPEGFLAFDHQQRRVFAAWMNTENPPGWLQSICHRWSDSTAEKDRRPPTQTERLPPLPQWKPTLPSEAYRERVIELQQSIAAGETYEACLTHAYTVECAADPLSIFLRLRRANPAPYAAYFAFDDMRLLSSSPELFLQLAPDGTLRSRPIKGTRPRGHTADRDAALREELRNHPKDQAENRMIVDLTRHDFCRVCSLGSVQVTGLLEVETHPSLHQLVSEIRGRLDPSLTPCQAVWACFPGGSMTGAPKERTVGLLAAIEAGPRGAYAGTMGYFSRDSGFCLAMTIRTLENRGRDWRLGCGGAVLADSDPEAEWKEALLKARSVIDAVD